MAIHEGPRGHYDNQGRYHPAAPDRFNKTDRPPHTHGGTDAPECTTCAGQPGYEGKDYRFWIDGPGVQATDINWADVATKADPPIDYSMKPYKVTDCCKHCDDHAKPNRHTVSCHSCANEHVDFLEGVVPYYDYKISDMHPVITGGSIRTGTGTVVDSDCITGPLVPNDPVNHPSHYNSGPRCSCGKTIECIDITRHHTLLRGTAIKYLWRADYKGSKIEDLKKSIWYIQKEIDSLEDW